ncbi:pantoate--beta-alanine ligase [Pseudothermotoga lettingae]|jgi:pantoate--beta-alanine ligase|uniref:Pantothenate synthetase n=1 Tax=Pseudothermotoga lettingae (strain ATCC BAA-301 / DSM 14385 / NBRC 107922 / TMO) TaxID=416591 RepID=PANC_PSELT|nr:pantoate--beta-alanine ligase [Pseudothermotoga lettingae]A8F7T6.1 RecName: Full=Pantothenate synthetase; Short=PS; AltName: Full=Pantoate--beta-alanine ligase; AltName: Full=Pantoate-activating enzyme [Pseudothermotoga lettingae TMO]ABV34220.1 pantoate--beta-alanine ligase [Pseudothermotoga lettingae TMO]GLI48836.1 pantothenate synthetase [Pseudothermotoga lettingae TMO]
MVVVKNIDEMKKICRELRKEKTIGFVPTMGYLHEGHLSLVRRSKKENDITVVSIFVNPTQFGPNEDYNSYPRNLNRDASLLEKEDVDYVFIPEIEQMYPKDYSTYINEEKLSRHLCGRSRPGHFRGVCTVVTKLFNIVKPNRAYFGQKDAQQFRVIRRMVRDLNMDVEVIECPIVREPDGLAMSSRNIYLSTEERNQALALNRSLKIAENLYRSGEKNTERMKEKIVQYLSSFDKIKIDYVEIVSEETLEPVEKIEGKVVVAIAAWVGKARLIDNTILGEI